MAAVEIVTTILTVIQRVKEMHNEVVANRARAKRLGERLVLIVPLLERLSRNTSNAEARRPTLETLLALVQEIEEFLSLFRFNEGGPALERARRYLDRLMKRASDAEAFLDYKERLRDLIPILNLGMLVDIVGQESEDRNDLVQDVERMRGDIEHLKQEKQIDAETIRKLQEALAEHQNAVQNRQYLRSEVREVMQDNDGSSSGKLERRAVRTMEESTVTLGESLGMGSFGIVHTAVIQATRQSVAVKKLRPEILRGADSAKLTRQIKREAVIMSMVACAHIVQFQALLVTRANVALGLVVELCVCTLHEVLHGRERAALRSRLFPQSRGTLDLQSKLRLLRQCVTALQYLHGLGIVHRDIKPGNILLRADGSVAVSDFGLSKLLQSPELLGSVAGTATEAGQAKGTVPYMAPEIVLAERMDAAVYTPAVDVYAMAIVVNEVLAEAAPYQGMSVQNIAVSMGRTNGSTRPELFTSSASGSSAEMASVSRMLQSLVQTAWQLQPAQRGSAQTMAVRLDLLLSNFREEGADRLKVPERACEAAVKTEKDASTKTESRGWLAGFLGFTRKSGLSSESTTRNGRAVTPLGTTSETAATHQEHIVAPSVVFSGHKEVLRGHTKAVSCLCFLPNNMMISGGEDNTLILWNLVTKECVKVFKGHTNTVCCIAVLSDGRLISGSRDNTLRIWNLSTGETEKVLTGHSKWVSCVSVLSGNRVISGCYDWSLIVWDVITGTALSVLRGHSGSVLCLVVLPNGQLASGGKDRKILIWDLPLQRSTCTLSEHYSGVSCLSVLSSDRLASGSWDRTIRIWNYLSGECLSVLRGHEGDVECLCVLSDGRLVSAGGVYINPKGGDTKIRIWNTETGECTQTLEGHGHAVRCLLPLSDGRLASGSYDNTILLWSPVARTPLSHLVSFLSLGVR